MQTLFDWLSNPAFSALALSLLASLWQAAIAFMVVLGLLLLNKNAPARIKYNIAGIGQLVVACWFIQTFLHHLSLQTTLSNTLVDHESAMLFYPGKLPILSGLYTQDAGSTPFQLSRCIPLALCLYFIGMFIMFFRVVYAYCQTRLLKSRGIFTAPAVYIRHMETLCSQLGIYHKVKLYLSDRVNVPVMMGFIKPVILLPISIATHLSTAQIEAIITHELAHIRRWDYLINFIQSVIEALFFFNPFVWLLSNIMREQREKACDELVVRKVPAYTYATALLALEKINGTKCLTLAANGHRSFKLLNRIKLFTMKQNPIMTVKQKTLSVLLIVVGLGCIAWLSPDKSAKQKEKQHQQTTSQVPTTAAKSQRVTVANQNDSTPQHQPQGSATNKDFLTPELQKQIDEIGKSAGQMAAKITSDDSWKKSVAAIQNNAAQLVSKIQQDTSWKTTVAQLTKDAMALSSKMKEDPELQKQMQALENKARQITADYKTSPELQRQLEAIRNNSMALALKLRSDTSWKTQLKTIRFKAEQIAKQMKDNPEMAKKIKEMAESYKGIAFKVINDPKFQEQLQKLRSDIQGMKLMQQNSEE